MRSVTTVRWISPLVALLFPVRAVLVVLWVILGLLSVTLVFPFAPQGLRTFMVRHWSRVLMFFCGVAVRPTGAPLLTGPVMWVANHVSWVDIFVLNSVRPVAFIAKSEIRRWPVIGWLVAGAGTVFIERGRRHAVRLVGHEMKRRFDRNEVIGLFPEGTTSPGFDVAPFHSSLFDPAIRAEVLIQPVALVFYHGGRRSDRAAFVGEQNLLQNLWFLLTTRGVVVELVFLPAVSTGEAQEMGRASVAVHARDAIRQVVAGDSIDSAVLQA